MRLAVLSDIHGNSIALDAVLADIATIDGVDEYWVLGDLAALGHDPVGVLQRLSMLENVYCTRGNADYYLTSGERPAPTIDDVERDPSLLPVFAEVMQSFAWTQGAVTATGWLDWLAALPIEHRCTLPDSTRVLGVHAAPGLDNGPGIHPGLSDMELGTILEGARADLVFVGHTHLPLDRTVHGCRVVNLGSVSNQVTRDVRASYVLLEADASGYEVHRRRVAYDLDAVRDAVQRARHPGAPYILKFTRGEVRSRYSHLLPDGSV